MKGTELTSLLGRYRQGDDQALALLVEEIYDDLRRIAHRQLGGHQRDAVVNTTVIVHEAYFRLQEQDRDAWQDREHFMAVAARAMRQIIVDFARRARAEKRGSGAVHVNLDETQVAATEEGLTTLLDIDAALTRLAGEDEPAARLFEFRFFGGMAEQEAANAMGTSLRTSQRQWKLVKAYFAHAMR